MFTFEILIISVSARRLPGTQNRVVSLIPGCMEYLYIYETINSTDIFIEWKAWPDPGVQRKFLTKNNQGIN
jgi:hypothetical protein